MLRKDRTEVSVPRFGADLPLTQLHIASPGACSTRIAYTVPTVSVLTTYPVPVVCATHSSRVQLPPEAALDGARFLGSDECPVCRDGICAMRPYGLCAGAIPSELSVLTF